MNESRRVAGEERLDVHLAYGAGRLQLGPAEAGMLYRLELRYDEESWEPRTEYDGGKLRVGLDGRDRSINVKDGRSGHLELELSREVPLDLRMEFGAARADLDLSGLALTDLQLRTGASETVVESRAANPSVLRRAELEVGAADFTARGLGFLNAEEIDVSAGVGEVTLAFDGDWRRDARVEVHMGVGSLRLLFPRDLGIRLERSTFLTSFEAPGLIREGKAYLSENWDRAARRVTVEIDAAFGGIEVGWID